MGLLGKCRFTKSPQCSLPARMTPLSASYIKLLRQPPAKIHFWEALKLLPSHTHTSSWCYHLSRSSGLTKLLFQPQALLWGPNQWCTVRQEWFSHYAREDNRTAFWWWERQDVDLCPPGRSRPAWAGAAWRRSGKSRTKTPRYISSFQFLPWMGSNSEPEGAGS